MKKSLIAFLAAALMAASLAGCQNTPDNSSSGSSSAGTTTSASSTVPQITEDLAGNPITVPQKADKIISLAASNTDILVALGLADKLVAIDTYSTSIEGAPTDVPQFDQMTPDTEQIIAQHADVVFVSGMSNLNGEDVFKPVRDAGICVAEIPSANSVEEIEKSILFIGNVTGQTEKAQTLVNSMQSEIDKIKQAVASVTEKKTVYFEIGSEPALYTFGTDTFLNEMIEIVGAKNVFADQSSWISVSEEAVITANPDVIFTNAGYMADPVGDVLSRSNWSGIAAVKNKQVYYIDNNASSLPSHNIIKALQQMAKAVYPDLYKD